jgi:AcrR family transcriptional regulator
VTEERDTASRAPLTKDRVVHAAVDLADRDGLGALTMRRLGAELGVEAMSLYKHVANKEEILDGMVEHVIGEIEIPAEGAEWKEAMRRRAISARKVLSRHSWAIGLMEAGVSPGPTTLRYRDAIIGNLRSAGFSMENAAHAFSLLDSYVYGQVIQEISLSRGMTDTAASTLDQTAMNEYPHLVAMYEHALTFEFTFDGEFEFGLELLLEGLERHRYT